MPSNLRSLKFFRASFPTPFKVSVHVSESVAYLPAVEISQSPPVWQLRIESDMISTEVPIQSFSDFSLL